MFVYFKELGFSYLQIGSLFSVMAISSLIFEIPAGSFSDRYGAKYSIMLSSLIFTFVFLSIGTFQNYIIFLGIFVFWGAAKAFYSGSDVTLIIESLKHEKLEHKTSKYIGYKWSAFYGGLCLGGLLSPFIITFGKAWTFYTTSLLYFISIILMSKTKQTPFDTENAESIHHVKTLKEYLGYLNQGRKYLLTHDLVKYLLILNVILVTASMIFFQYLQHILKSIKISEVSFGYYYAAFTFFAALASRKSHSVDVLIGMKRSILLIFITTLLSLFGVFSLKTYLLSLIPIILMQIQAGLCIPLMTSYLNRFIESHNRTTLNSMKSFIGGVSLALLSSGIGYLADLTDFRIALVALGVIIMIVCISPLIKVIKRG